MKTKYEPVSNSVAEMVDRVMNAFPDKFLHINRNDLCLMFKDAPASSWRARTRIFNGLYRTLTGKKILVEFSKQDWELDTEIQRAVLIYRELLKVAFSDKKKDYVIRRYDVQDFREVLEKLGLSYENADKFFASLVVSK
jgi:hypothetical protein